MTMTRRSVAIALAAPLGLLMALMPAVGAHAGAVPSTTTPQLPQVVPAQQGAEWLASQLTAQDYIPTSPGSGVANLAYTAQTVLALSSANVDLAGARAALTYLAANVDNYVPNNGADGPGQLALLILDAVALGDNPRSFGGSNLVTRLLATQQASGSDAGLFGTENQAVNYAAGGYQQGLALAALAAAGVKTGSQVTAAVSWLTQEQCPDGGWTSPDNTNNACSGVPADYDGPDTNSTAFAVEGLAAVGALTSGVATNAFDFLTAGQDADAGWSYYPNTNATPGSTDPDSTALVIQALVALGKSPTSAPFVQGSATPVSALLSFQLTSGSGSGGFYFPPAPAPADIIASYEAVPALSGLSSPFGPSGGSYWLAGADGGVFGYGSAGFFGSLPSQGVSVHDVTSVATTADGKGYWLAGSDGGIFDSGDAVFHGSLPGLGVHVHDIVGLAATSDGGGYWLVGSDGGVFGFGDAAYHGSLPASKVHVGDIDGIVATPDGGGYWLVGSDGGVFGFGDATYHGSLPASKVHVSDIVAVAPSADGGGYWLVGSDGGVFGFGDAAYHGSLPASGLHADNVVGIAATADSGGYYLVSKTGGVFAFGDAVFSGSASGTGVSDIVAVATSPTRPV
jgi:Squalene-hopene cyclase C-terminal domain